MSEDNNWSIPAPTPIPDDHQWGSLLESRVAAAHERELAEEQASKKGKYDHWWQRVLMAPVTILGGTFFLIFGAVSFVVRGLLYPFRRIGRFLWRYRIVRLIAKPFLFIAYGLWKLKTIFIVLFKLKGVATFASMFVSIAAYALIWGWVFAAGFVVLLFIHEMGHWVVLKHHGVKTSPVLFIPFLGAVIGMKEMPKDAYKEAQMALGGPLLGSAAALACLVAAHFTHSGLLGALAYIGFFLNLFNLLPIVPLDGGRAMAAVHPLIWLLGLAGLAGLVVYWHVWTLLILFVVFGFPELSRRLGDWRGRHNKPEVKDYYALSLGKRVGVGLVYISLAAALAIGMKATYVKRYIHQPKPQAASFYFGPVRAEITPACYSWWSKAQGRYVAGYPIPHGAELPNRIKLAVKGDTLLAYAYGHGSRQLVNWHPCGTYKIEKTSRG